MSIFNQCIDQSVVISPGFLDRLRQLIAEDPDLDYGHAIFQAWKRTTGRDLDEPTAQLIAQRLEEPKKDSESESPGKVDPKPGLGTKYMQWINGLGFDEVCLWIADYDWNAAFDLYFHQDFTAVVKVMEVKSSECYHKVLASFEGSMYGFGGKYQDDEGGDSKTVDVSDAEGMAAMDAALGLG